MPGKLILRTSGTKQKKLNFQWGKKTIKSYFTYLPINFVSGFYSVSSPFSSPGLIPEVPPLSSPSESPQAHYHRVECFSCGPKARTIRGSSENTCTLWATEGTALGICGEMTEWPLTIPAAFIFHGRFRNP